MAIEDTAYEELVQKVNALLACGRQAMARKWLLDLAYAILRHYGYDVVEATAPTTTLESGKENQPPHS